MVFFYQLVQDHTQQERQDLELERQRALQAQQRAEGLAEYLRSQNIPTN